MNKKILLVVTSVITMLCFSSCKNEEDLNINDLLSTDSVETEITEEIELTSTSEESTLLTRTYQVLMEPIYVDVPDFNQIEGSYTEFFMVNNSKYVAFTCLYKESGTNAKDAFDITFENYMNNTTALHTVNGVANTEGENITVNGIDTYRVIGALDCGVVVPYEAYMYSYSFVYNGYPCSIIGVVMDEEQPQEDIDNITEIVDAMMKTVRSEE